MIDFVCMANEAYRHWVELCVRAIERRHPQSKIHLFDLSEARENRLRESFGSRASVSYTHFPPAGWTWPAWIDRADFDFVWPNFGLRDALKYHSRRLRMRFGARNENWMTDKEAHLARAQRAQRMYAQKPHVIRRAAAATANPLVFIDVDAIVLRPLEAVFAREFDLAVTTEAPRDVIVGPEPPECIERPSYPWKAINVGVIFLRNSPRLGALLDAWVREMESVYHLSIEQTALANLIYRRIPDFFESHERTRQLELEGGARVSVMALPMAIYNFTHIDRETRFPAETAVAHFAGGKKQQQHWDWVQQMISRELERPYSSS